MLEQATGSRGARVGWVAALVAVPVALAGVSLIWPGAQVGDQLREQSREALVMIGLTDVAIAVDGRDVGLAGVPPGSEQVAANVVGAVPGVREVTVEAAPASPVVAAPATTVPVAPPAVPPPTIPPAPLADRLGAVVAAVPITFAADRADLVGAPAATVAQVAGLLVAETNARVDVEGHVADTPGSPEVAQELSEQRAQVVADALVAAGVDRGRITVRGLGAGRPLATPEASRRVEIRIP